MIKLIILEGENPVFNPEVRMFVPFRKLIERDRGTKGDADGRKKLIATKELAFIYWFADPRSIYHQTYKDERQRTEKIINLIGLPTDWKIDKDIRDAIDFYVEEIKEDFDVQQLDAGEIACGKTKDYLKNVDYSEKDAKGNLMYDPVKVSKVVGEIGKNLQSLKEIRNRIFLGEKFNPKIRGGHTPKLFGNLRK